MQESDSIAPADLKTKYKQAEVDAWGEVIAEDDVRVVLVNTKWYHCNGSERIEDTWFIVKGAIISREKMVSV
jgi:hypothetical protein